MIQRQARIFRAAMAILFVWSLSGCMSNSTAINGGIPPAVVPTIGSYFVLQHQSSYEPDTFRHTFAVSDLHRFGKENVHLVLTSHGTTFTGADTSYYYYEPNGDLTIYGDAIFNGLAPRWITYPFGSQGSNTTIVDTLLKKLPVREVFKFEGGGTGLVTINGTAFPTQRTNVTLMLIWNDTTQQTVTRVVDFAPSLGEIVRSEQAPFKGPTGGEPSPAEHMVMVDYHFQ